MSILTERAQAFAEIQDYLVSGCLSLFGAYGMPVEYAVGGAAEIRGPAVMAVIGYATQNMRGALLILTSREVVAALTPTEARVNDAGAEPASLRDVLGEFSNMLLGRIKNQLILREVAPLLATPTTVFGDHLELPAPTSGMSAWHTFSGPAGDVFVRFDATFDAAFALSPAVDGRVPALAEGEMILF